MSKRTLLNAALRSQKTSSVFAPKANYFASRLGMTNKYAYDYACEDEYFEREMTLLDAKIQSLPLPPDFKHKEFPKDEFQPAHWNDVRFNFLPQNLDRRGFQHDNLSITYNMHADYYHGCGYQDEDMDYELPDPYEGMHQKYKRNGTFMFFFGPITIALVVGYPTLGLKMPQKDNPTYMRKKYGTTGTIQQMQGLAMTEWAGAVDKQPDSTVMYTRTGFHQTGNGFRMDLDSYKDLIC